MNFVPGRPGRWMVGGALVASVGLFAAGPALAQAVETPVTGTLGKTIQTCLQLLTVSVSEGENCTYGGTVAPAFPIPPQGEEIGPNSFGYYYSDVTTPDAWVNARTFVPANGDGKLSAAIEGTITVDRGATPANPADDLISFSLTISDPNGGKVVRILNAVVERYASVTQTLAPRTASSATANAAGGFDYIIGSAGFPSRLVANELSECEGQPYGDFECAASFNVGLDTNKWGNWPGSAGLGGLEGNIGAKTSGTVTGLECTAGPGAAAGVVTTVCNTNQTAWNPVVNGPNNAGGGSSPTERGAAEDVGWDQVLLKVSTDVTGRVVSAEGFDVEEYRVFGQARCGDNTTGTGTYTAICNSWHSSYFTLASVAAGVVANDDGPVDVLQGATVTIDVLANDTDFDEPVTVEIITPPAKGTAVVTNSPGNADVVRIEYTADADEAGPDSFVYSVDDGSSTDTAIVTVNVTSALPVASPGTITIATAGRSPAGATGTFTAPGPGGSLGTPTATVTVTAQGANGTATVGSGNVITYAIGSATFFTGSDSFTYQIEDGDGDLASATVTVNVPDVMPMLAGGSIFTEQNRTSAPLLPGVTPGNGSAAQHVLAVTAQGANGTCSLTATDGSGAVTYAGSADFAGSDSCTIRVTDGDGDAATAVINVTVAPVDEVEGRIGGASGTDPWTLLLLAAAGLARWRRRLAAAGAALLAVGSVMPAAAQDAGKGEPDGAAGIGEIIVTARKVSESLKDVPLAITAFDAATIQAAGISNLTDVAELTPGLSFFNAFGENLPVPVIRGVAPTDIFGGNNAAVFIDGVFISGREGLNFSQLDLERIEVVKGPQSALYGRNAFSGALNYVTRDPSDEFEAKTLVEAGNYGKRRGNVMISGPILGETLTGRASFLYDEWDGSYDNPLSGVDVGGYRYRSWQGKLLWKPTDDLRVSLGYYKSNDDIDDPATVTLPANCEDRIDDGNTTVRLQNFCGEIPDIEAVPTQFGSRDIQKPAQATGENRYLDRLILRADWDLGGSTITSLTGYSYTKQNSVSDFTRNLGNGQPFLYCIGTPEEPNTPNSCGSNPADQVFFSGVYNPQNDQTTEEWSQELRFASPQDRRLRVGGGLYAFTLKFKSEDGGPIATVPLPDTGPGTQPGLAPFDPASAPNFAIGTAIFYPSFTPDGGLDPLKRTFSRNYTDSWAVFGSLDFDLTDRLTARAEMRYTQESIENQQFGYRLCAERETLGGPPDPTVPCGDDFFDLAFPAPKDFFTGPGDVPENVSLKGSARFDWVSGRVSLDFKLTDDWLIYGSVASGEKPGGFQLVTVDVLQPPPEPQQRRVVGNPFDPEKLTAYELGVKGVVFDRLSIDAAVFYNDWSEIVFRQLQETDPASGLPLEQPTAFNVNSGDADVWGFELGGALQITDRLRASASLGWVDAELTDAAQEQLRSWPSFAPNGDVSGNKLLRQPEWDGSFSLSYDRELANDWKWYARGDATYQSGVYVGNDNQSWLPERTYVNARLGFRSSRYTIELWGRNLLEDDSAVAAFRDISWANTDRLTPPYGNGPRPDFDKFVPLRYTVTYPRLRQVGINFEMRFGGLVR
jgi:iron complex outermembrane receptor protein